MLKVLQYNVYFGNHDSIELDNRLENVCSCILSVDADVVCLQEVLGSKYNLLCERLGVEYPHSFPKVIKKKYDTVIMSKHPISKYVSHMFEFTEMGRDIKAITVNIGGKRVIVATSHFESEFGESVMKKTYQYKRCADILTELNRRTNIPVILCADTNVCDQSEYQFETAFSYASDWKDTWIETGSDNDQKITFDSETNPILLVRYRSKGNKKYVSRLDRILHISNFHAVDFSLIGTGSDIVLSDHYGVTCTFEEEKPSDRGNYIPVNISSHKRGRVKVVGKRQSVIGNNYRPKKMF